ncbi:MAG TPA: mechanosensitive ion channel family protein [Gemmatimonadales bacterium]|nr:mechanosensitive ion channel family protein [Gemmatimonadales bacterium]
MDHWIQDYLPLPPGVQSKLLETLLTVGGLWLVHRLVLALVYRRSRDPWTRYRWRKSLTYLAFVLGVVLLGHIWVESVAAVATFLGLVSAGLAIALRDPIVNLAGWIYLVWRRPFEVGDRVQIGANAGDVIDLHVFNFTLNEIGNWVDADQSTGRIIHIPNGRVFTEAVANYDKGFRYIWNEIPVVVTFESNWKLAKAILERIAVKHAEHLTEQAEKDLLEASRQFFISYTRLTPIVYTSVVEIGVRLTMRYLIQPRHRRGSEQAIWQDVLDEFAACPDIDFAYQTIRQFRNPEEGKPGTRPA